MADEIVLDLAEAHARGRLATGGRGAALGERAAIAADADMTSTPQVDYVERRSGDARRRGRARALLESLVERLRRAASTGTQTDIVVISRRSNDARAGINSRRGGLLAVRAREPDDFAFCPACGASLAAEHAPREVRKVVTVLFCDLTGSTAIGDRTDPEALRALMNRYYDAPRTVLERHGGTVEKFVGDAVMAVFGIPVASEDDALRAVRSAVELRDVVHGLGLRCGSASTQAQVVAGEGERSSPATR